MLAFRSTDKRYDGPIGLHRLASLPWRAGPEGPYRQRVRGSLMPNAERKAKIARGTTTLKSLLCRTLRNSSEVNTFLTDFNAVIADQWVLSIADCIALDIDRSQVIDVVDREYWLDVLLKRSQSNARLGSAYGTGDDPLGLTAGRFCYIIDGSSPNRKYVGKAGDTNGVYNDEARTSDTGHNLWDNDNDNTPSDVIFGDFESASENFSGTSVRRYPRDGQEVTVFVRGGTYTQIRAINITKNDPAIAHNKRIIFRSYPGETVTLNMGNEKIAGVYEYDYMFVAKRPTVKVLGIDFVGHRFDAGEDGNVYAPNCISFSAEAGNGALIGCTVTGFRSLPAENGWDVSHPQYIDIAFTNRENYVAGTGDGSAGSAFGLLCDAKELLIRRCVFAGAEDDYPYVGGYPSGAANYFGGETIRMRANNPTIMESVFRGPAPHAHIHLMAMSGALVERNAIENPEHICMLVGGNGVSESGWHIIRYNHLSDFGLIVPTDDTGGGMEVFASSYNDIYGNVIWSRGTEVGDDNTGIWIMGDIEFPTLAKGNKIHHNFFRKNNLFIGHAGGTTEAAYSRVQDNLAYNNVVLGMDTPHQSNPFRNSPVHYFIRDENVDYGNRFTTNFIMRFEGGPIFTVHFSTPSNNHSDYDIDDTLPSGGATTYTGNITGTAASVVLDEANADMRLVASSPVAAWFSGETRIPYRRTDLYEAENPLRDVCPLLVGGGVRVGGALWPVGIKTGGQL